MDDASFLSNAGAVAAPPRHKPGLRAWAAATVALGLAAGVVVAGPQLLEPAGGPMAAPSPPGVGVSHPLPRNIDTRLEFLGQFAAVQQVDLRPQVGGTLMQIGFKDGDIVQKGQLLFLIDPTPYQIRLSEAQAALEAARARLALAQRELHRAAALSATGAGTVQTTDQAVAEQLAAQAAMDGANAQIRDAQFDLDHTRVTAPFTGKISNHLASVGDLISGSRAGNGPTTLLSTLVSTGPIYLNFDMSESDYMAFLRNRLRQSGMLAEPVRVALTDEIAFNHQGTLDFVDNGLDAASGTIHARATVPGSALMTPGGFARIRVEIAPPAPALLVPDAAVLPDQSQHIVLTVGPNDKVVPKIVQLGDLRFGLRVITGGLKPSDEVIVSGIPTAAPGSKITPANTPIQPGSDLADDGDEQ